MKSQAVEGRFALIWPALACACAPVLETFLRGRFGGDPAGVLVVGFLHAGTAAALVAALAAGWRIRGTGPSAWLAAWVLVLLAAAVLGRGGLAGLPAVSFNTACLLVFLLCSMSSQSAVFLPRALALGLIIQAAASSLFAIWQRHFGFSLMAQSSAYFAGMDGDLVKMIQDRIAEGRAYGFFLYPNAFAGFLALAIPPALEGAWRALAAGRKLLAALYGAVCLLLVAGLVYSSSIGAAAALVAAFAVAAFLWHRDALSRLVPGAVGAALLLLVILVLRTPSALTGGFTVKMSHVRQALAQPVGVKEVLVGRGPGMYGPEVGIRMNEGLRSRCAHNWLLETWVETGLAGIVALGGAILLIGWSILRGAGSAAPAFHQGLSIGWLAWLLHSFVDIDYTLPVLAFPWWAISGVLAGVAARKTAPSPAVVGVLTAPAVLRSGIAALAVLCVLLALTKGALCVFLLGIVFSAALLLFFTAALPGPGMPGRFSGADPAGLLLIAAAGGWVLVSRAPGLSFEAMLKALGFFAVAWSVRAAARMDGRLEKPVRFLFILVCSVFSFWAVGSVLGGAPSGRAGFASPNALAGFLLLGLGLALGTLARESGGMRWGSLAAVCAIGAGLAATKSAAGFASAVLAASAVMLVLAFKSRRHRLWLGAASLVLPLAVFVAGVPSIDPLSVVQRLSMWREAAMLIRGNPFGMGPGMYSAAVDAVRQPSITCAGVSRFSLRAEFSHNEPMQFAAEWGIPALGFVLLLAIGAVRAGRGSFLPWILAAFAVLTHGLADFPLRVPAIQVFLAFALGFLTSGGGRERARAASFPLSGTGAAFTLLLLVLTASFAARPGLYRLKMEASAENAAQDMEISRSARPLHPLAHDSYIREGAAAWSGFGRMPEKLAPLASVAETNLRRASALSGAEWSVAMVLGRFLLDRADILGRKADREEARRVFESAILSAPSLPQSRVWMARSWIAERGWDLAIDALDAAERVEPLYLEAGVLRAYVEERRGNLAAARHFYRRALIIHGLLRERAGLNDYERSLAWLNESEVKGRLLNLVKPR